MTPGIYDPPASEATTPEHPPSPPAAKKTAAKAGGRRRASKTAAAAAAGTPSGQQVIVEYLSTEGVKDTMNVYGPGTPEEADAGRQKLEAAALPEGATSREVSVWDTLAFPS